MDPGAGRLNEIGVHVGIGDTGRGLRGRGRCRERERLNVYSLRLMSAVDNPELQSFQQP